MKKKVMSVAFADTSVCEDAVRNGPQVTMPGEHFSGANSGEKPRELELRDRLAPSTDDQCSRAFCPQDNIF